MNERNVVDIVLKLIANKKVNLIFTSDGKEYLTPSALETEMINLLKSTKNDFYVKEIYVGTGTKYRTVYKSKDLKKALLWTVGE